MLLSVLLISSAVLGAATIAGLLVLFQLRQTADAESSAQAVFAADAGMERALYVKYHDPSFVCSEGATLESPPGDFEIAGDGDNINYLVRFLNTPTDGGEPNNCNIGQSAGRSGRSARAFILYFEGIENFPGQFFGP